MSPRQVAPRAYCDICEEFDLHETENCPLQASEDAPACGNSTDKGKKPPPRSYCELCESIYLKKTAIIFTNQN